MVDNTVWGTPVGNINAFCGGGGGGGGICGTLNSILLECTVPEC